LLVYTHLSPLQSIGGPSIFSWRANQSKRLLIQQNGSAMRTIWDSSRLPVFASSV